MKPSGMLVLCAVLVAASAVHASVAACPCIELGGRPFAPALLLPAHSLSGDDLRHIGGVEFLSLSALAESMGGTLSRSATPGVDLVLEAQGYRREFSVHKPDEYWLLPDLLELVPELAPAFSASVAPHVGSRDASAASFRSAQVRQAPTDPLAQWLFGGYRLLAASGSSGTSQSAYSPAGSGGGYWPSYFGGVGSRGGYAPGGGGNVSVRGYYRKDGTYVRPHTRSAPRR